MEQCGRIKALGYSAVPLHMRDGAPDVKGPCHQSGRGKKVWQAGENKVRGLPIAPTPLMGQSSIYQTCCCCDWLGLGSMPCHGSEVSGSHHGGRAAAAGPYHIKAGSLQGWDWWVRSSSQGYRGACSWARRLGSDR